MKVNDLKFKLDTFFGFDISTTKRQRKYVDARTIFVHISRHYLYNTYYEIAEALNRNHASCINLEKRFNAWEDDIGFNKKFREAVDHTLGDNLEYKEAHKRSLQLSEELERIIYQNKFLLSENMILRRKNAKLDKILKQQLNLKVNFD